MLLKTSQLLNMPVMSLQTGSEIARTTQLVISPTSLAVIGFELAGKQLVEQPSFLRLEDVREISNIGLIVDSSEDVSTLDDIIKLRDIYELNFQIANMKVVDTQGNKLGKVYDTTFSTDTFAIEQLCVARPILKSFGESELLIHRRQIIEINRDTIIVRAPTVRNEAKVTTTNPVHVRFQDGNVVAQPETATQQQ